MKRIPFSQVLKSAAIDIRREYSRLYELFFVQKYYEFMGKELTLWDCCARDFLSFPFRGTCVSLEDFDDFYGYRFERNPSNFDLDYLISFCEYSYNLAMYNQNAMFDGGIVGVGDPMLFYIQQVLTVIENIGYIENIQGGVTDFVPKDQVAISVAEIIDPDLSYRTIEYNHHSMKGDLERKKATLVMLADKLEPKRTKLNRTNDLLESDLFFLLNNVNVRHNNTDREGKKYIPFVANMNSKEMEQWYDDIYQMCLLAFMELDHIERKKRVKQLKEDIKTNR